MKTNTLAPELLRKIDAYWRAANYLSVGQIYLFDNPLLKQPLNLAHIKPRRPRAAYVKQAVHDKLIEHKQYIARHGEDLPEIRNWEWSNPK